jgi:GNAT superfamily N-acetyltransferase
MADTTVSVRPADQADRVGILALAPRLAGGVAPWRDQARALAAARRWLEEALAKAAQGSGTVFVAVDRDNTIVGVLGLTPATHFTGEHDAYIGELAVAGPAARTGIGRVLIAAAESWAHQRNLTHLTLHTGARNTPARAFYAALGFAEEEVRLTRPVAPE